MVQFGQREGVLGGRAMFGVRCEPHVSMKLKQVFPKISPQQGLITIAVLPLRVRPDAAPAPG